VAEAAEAAEADDREPLPGLRHSVVTHGTIHRHARAE
jgi:hypothetical protein